MTRNALSMDPGLTVFMAVAGIVFGLVYFATLKLSVTLFVAGKGWFGPTALTLGRIGAAVALLYVAAKLGAAPLLAAFIGFLMARAWALRAEGRAG
jgi:N-ATPase, AtpR subunit